MHAATMETEASAWARLNTSGLQCLGFIPRLLSASVSTNYSATKHSLSSACDCVRCVQASPYIDFMSVHMYPDSWLVCSDECKLDWAQRWVRTVFHHKP